MQLYAKLLCSVNLAHAADGRAVAEDPIVNVSLVDGLISTSCLSVTVLALVASLVGLETTII